MFYGPASIPITAATAMAARQRRADSADTPGHGVGGLLADMAEDLSGAECYLVLCLLSAMCSLTVALCFGILCYVIPSHRVHWSWFYLCFLAIICFIGSTVVLIDPRPMHWLPSLSNMAGSCRRCSPTECRMRVRRWWHWRTRYAAKTKLNV